MIFFVVGSILVFSLSNYTKPFYDDPNNHIQELKKIPEVKKFYDTHKNISVDTREYQLLTKTGEREQNKFRIEFYSKSNNESHLLQVYYYY